MSRTEEKLGAPNRFCNCCGLAQHGGKFCPNCGDDLEEMEGEIKSKCARCGAALRLGSLYCGECGKGLFPTGVCWRFVTSLLWLLGVVQAVLLFFGQQIADRFAKRR